MSDEQTTPQGDQQALPESVEPGSLDTGIELVQVQHPDFGAIDKDLGQEPAFQPDRQEVNQGDDDLELAGQGAGGKEGAGEDSDDEPQKPYAVLKYRGEEIPVESEEKMIQLAQQGLDYTTKTQVVAPYVGVANRLIELEARDPATAQQLRAILNGQAVVQPAPQEGKEQGQPQKAKPLDIIVQDKDGNPVKVDPMFLDAMEQFVELRGLGKPAESPTTGPPQVDPFLAIAAGRERIKAVADHVRSTYGRDDFVAAIPVIQRTMLERGMTMGDPRDNPDTWLSIYNELGMKGQLPSVSEGQTHPAPSSEIVTTQRQNKSEAKRQATHPNGSNAQGAKKAAWRKATERAIESGEMTDFRAAVAARISHPDI